MLRRGLSDDLAALLRCRCQGVHTRAAREVAVVGERVSVAAVDDADEALPRLAQERVHERHGVLVDGEAAERDACAVGHQRRHFMHGNRLACPHRRGPLSWPGGASWGVTAAARGCGGLIRSCGVE